MSALQLMKKDKLELATYIKSECRGSRGTAHLNILLDYLLDPAKPVADEDRMDWCRYLIAGGLKFDIFSRTVSSYDNAVICGLVWSTDFVAYRCRTCGLSPCMSLCADCFQAGDHTGHDYNMFRSHAGGACDCGDDSVMKPEGFCCRHGSKNARKTKAPEELMCVAKYMMPRLIERLLLLLRDHYNNGGNEAYSVSMPDMELYLDFLHELNDMGAAMREIIAEVLIDENLYTTIINNMKCSSHLKLSQSLYERAMATLRPIRIPEEFTDVTELSTALTHHSMLEEMLLWVLKYEYPQKLVTLLLGMLPIDPYKEAFATGFVKHYQYLSTALFQVSEPSRMANCVVHISVQLFSPRTIASRLVRDHNLLHITLASLFNMLNDALIDDESNENSTHRYVNCLNPIMKEHSYWPLASDLVNLLNQENIALNFISEPRLLLFWLRIISKCQGMNLNVRELWQHVEYEVEGYFAAFGAEHELCASPLWNIVSHLKDETTLSMSRLVLHAIIRALCDWLNASRIPMFVQLNPLQASFHYPLHRHLAIFLANAISLQGLRLDELFPLRQQEAFVHTLAAHPFQIFVALAEINCGLWVRNGQQIRGQALTYAQCHFCNATLDADLFLLQVLASRMEPDSLVMKVLMRFHVIDLLSVVSDSGEGSPHTPKLLGEPAFLTKDQEMPMLEQALQFLCTLLTTRVFSGKPDQELLRKEVVSLLCVADCTHSQLANHIPDKCSQLNDSIDIDATLKQVSVFKAPVFSPGGALQQGKYQPTDDVWLNEFDPLHVLLRATYKRDYVAAMDRYTDHVKRKKLYKGSSNPWPPFRQPSPLHPEYERLVQLLHCRTMHGLIFAILNKAVKDPSMPEAVLYYTLHLLELCLSLPNVEDPMGSTPYRGVQWRDKLFFTWFDSSSISDNVRRVIDEVQIWCPSTKKDDMSMELYSDLDLGEDLSNPPSPAPSLPGITSSPDHHSHLSLASLPFSLFSSFTRRKKKDSQPGRHRAVSGGVTQYTVWSPPVSSSAGGNGVDSLVTARHVDTAHTDPRSSQALTGTSPKSSGFADGATGASGREERKNSERIIVGESMVSLLLKLHKRFADAFGEERYKFPQISRSQPTPKSEPIPRSQEVVIAKFSSTGEHSFCLDTIGGLPSAGAVGAREKSKYARMALDGARMKQVSGDALVSGNEGHGSIGGNRFAGSDRDFSRGAVGGSSGRVGNINANIGCGNALNSDSDCLKGIAGSFDSAAGINTASYSGSNSGTSSDTETTRSGNKSGKITNTNSETGAKSQATKTSTTRQDNRVGDGVFFISKILDKICELNGECEAHVRGVVDRIYPPPAPSSHGSPRVTSEENRRRAKKRQEKLLKEFAAKQKQFMEKVIVTDISSADGDDLKTTSEAVSSEASLVHETLYDCCICNLSTPTTNDQPVGLVCLVQSTNVLGHRRHVKDPIELPLTSDAQFRVSAMCESYVEFLNRIRLLQDLFNEESCLMSVNMGWQGSVYASTCGHYLHLGCHLAYIDSLRSQAQTQLNQTLQVDRGEFWCPVCRQLSNSLLPLLPDVSQVSTDLASLSRLTLMEERRVVERLSDIFTSYSTDQVVSEAMKKSMQAVMDLLWEVTYPQYRANRFFSDTASLTYCYRSSLLRMNIELEMAHHKSGSPCLPLISSCAPKKSCIGPLFNILSNYCKKVQTKPHTPVWMQVTGISSELTSQQSLSVCKYNQDVPLLLRDQTALFLQFILSLPPSPDKSLYLSIVRAVYNVLLVQAFVSISLKFSADELSAWRGKGGQGEPTTLKSVMGQIVNYLEHSSIYEHDSMDTDLPAICQSVWSPLSVEAEAVKHLTPYLRVAAQLLSRLYNDTVPALSKENKHDEFRVLVGYLGLIQPGRSFSSRSGNSAGSISCTDCLNWVCDDPSALIRAWCLGLAAVGGSKSSTGDSTRLLLTQNPTWHNPRLISLPAQYNDLFQFYRKRNCCSIDPVSKSRLCSQLNPPKYPALCLVCSQLLCYKDQCCVKGGVGEAVQHAIDCGGGTAILLLIRSCMVSIIRGPRYTIWGSVYLDEHGEEDRELKRGRPLMLNEERYNMLRMLWLTHNFDQTCKLWNPHSNQL